MGYREGRFWKVDDAAAHALDRRFGWTGCRLLSAWPSSSACATSLHRRNLFDTGLAPQVGAPSVGPRGGALPDAADRGRQLQRPRATQPWGWRGRFGRNLPADVTWPKPEAEFMTPDPRDVSGSC